MIKRILGIVVIITFIGWLSVNYIYNSAIDVFTIDTSKEIYEKSAYKLINTKQIYRFGLINKSDKNVKLLKIQLQDYNGIKINNLSIEGKPFKVQEIPSQRVRIIFDYEVQIQQPVIRNPKSVLIIYSFMGLKHKQIVKIPGILK